MAAVSYTGNEVVDVLTICAVTEVPPERVGGGCGATLYFSEGDDPVTLTAEEFRAMSPKAGMYYVVHTDGGKSCISAGRLADAYDLTV